MLNDDLYQPEGTRIFIRDRLNRNRFVKTLNNFHIEYIQTADYTPNVSAYPISFGNFESLYDFISNVYYYDSKDIEDNLSIMRELKNLEIVFLSEDAFDNQDTFYMNSSVSDNTFLSLYQKNMFKNHFVKKYGTKIFAFYHHYTNFRKRKLFDYNIFDERLVFYSKNSFFDLGDVSGILRHHGINHECDWDLRCLIVFSEEDANFCHLCAQKHFQDLNRINLDNLIKYEQSFYDLFNDWRLQ